MATLSIKLGPAGTGSVVVDGYDITNATCGIRLDSRPGRVTEVTLDVLAYEAADVELDSPHLYLPDETRELLLRWGWTPPPEPQPETPGDPDCPNPEVHSVNGGPFRYCQCGWIEASP